MVVTIIIAAVVVWLAVLLFVVSLGAAAARGDKRLRVLRRRPERLPMVRLRRDRLAGEAGARATRRPRRA